MGHIHKTFFLFWKEWLSCGLTIIKKIVCTSERVSECLYLSGWFTLTRKQQREDNKQMLQPHQRWQKYTKMIKKKRRKIGVQTQKKEFEIESARNWQCDTKCVS